MIIYSINIHFNLISRNHNNLICKVTFNFCDYNIFFVLIVDSRLFNSQHSGIIFSVGDILKWFCIIQKIDHIIFWPCHCLSLPLLAIPGGRHNFSRDMPFFLGSTINFLFRSLSCLQKIVTLYDFFIARYQLILQNFPSVWRLPFAVFRFIIFLLATQRLISNIYRFWDIINGVPNLHCSNSSISFYMMRLLLRKAQNLVNLGQTLI